ncbi:MAG: lipopolysaccharide biosynthesis protein [Elusimicrobiales bacterium]|nr:lipopolysaccharide biosynthesis protein [Elusimicrobiales bacterium]
MPASVKKRFAVSLASNALRAGMSFLAGLLVARGLGPEDYGRLMFLLGSFVSIKSLLDLGTSNAFYTFISQAKRPLRYYSFYLAWLAAQFVATATAVALLLPDALVRQAWVGEHRALILLAFTASFLQQQLWQTVNQIGEASRKTIRVQVLNLALAVVYLAGAYALTALAALSIRAVLLLLIAQYIAAVMAAFKVLGPSEAGEEEGRETLSGMLKKYRDYCAPLALLSVAAFLYDFADKWMLQRFGGAIQQGFYQVSYQFASISVLATASILNIFWKETAEAVRRKDMARVERLFRKVSRSLYFFGALLSGFLIPWSGEIVRVFLGGNYASAVSVLALMFLYPVHQALGQIATTLLLAVEKTRQYFYISLAVMLFSFPAAYFLLAPPAWAVPGLGLGAIGLALKMVLVNIVSVNLILWVIAKNCGWDYEWFYQAAGLALAVGLGAAVKFLAEGVFQGLVGGGALPSFLLSALLYAGGAGAALRAMPWLAGLSREELLAYLKRGGKD